MDRKNFLAAVVPISTVINAAAMAGKSKADFFNNNKIPPYLTPGDTIGICCPSGYISLEDLQPAINKIEEWGFKIKVGSSAGAKDFTFAGSDDERTKDLQSMLSDISIKAIMFGRGGYGAVRIIDKINFTKFIAHPKWLIGFSDATVFHSHLNKNFGIASIHSKMCNSFPSNWNEAEPGQIDAIDSIRKCLLGVKMEYHVPSSDKNRPGTASGVLIGGNISLLQSLAGSASDIDTAGKILFLEEVDEYLYSIDRLMWYLKRAGKFHKLKGLIVGGFKIKPDDAGEEFGRTVYEIVKEAVKEFAYPVCFDFPVGHQKNNFALKCGVKHKLSVSADEVILNEV